MHSNITDPVLAPHGLPGLKDMAETRSRLRQAGLNPTPVTTHTWGADVMYLTDPEGNCLEFWC